MHAIPLHSFFLKFFSYIAFFLNHLFISGSAESSLLVHGLSLVVGHGFLTALASLVAEHEL